MGSIRLPSIVIAVVLGTWLNVACCQGLLPSEGRWLDDRAQVYRLDALNGTPTVVTMAYGACRRVCSTSLRMLDRLQALADERHVALNFLVVGLDASQDKPADWAAYRAEKKLDRSNWQFLSGDDASVRQMARRLGVRYWRYGEHTLHDFRIVLLSAQGHPLRSLDRFDQDVGLLLP